MNELLAKEKSLETLEPGVAPITREAPRVTSGPRKNADPFALLWKLRSKAPGDFELSRGKDSAKLIWPGLAVSSGELLELLKALPRVKRLHAAVKIGETTKSLSFDGKLRKSSLSPPEEEGLILFWKRAPEELSELAVPQGPGFQPSGEKLARFTLKAGAQRAKATLYRARSLQEPGVFFLRSGALAQKSGWDEFQVEAPHCQIVVEGDLDWQQELPEQLAAQCRKLAKLAQVRSRELKVEEAPAPTPLPSPALGHEDLTERLQDSPRFQAAYQSLKDGKPPLVTVLQIVEMLCHGGGQVPLEAVRERIGLPEHRLTTILSQMDGMLRGADEILLSTSIDQKVLLLDRDRLSKLFALDIASDEANVVRAETMDGEKRAVRLPIEVQVKERRALEALLRYGRLSEQELSRITASRRVGGMLERLLSRLEGEGFYGLIVVGEGAEGRIFAIQG